MSDIKQYIRPFHLLPDAPNNELALAGAIGATVSNPMTVTQEGPFEGFSFQCMSDAFTALGDHRCTVMIIDNGSRKQFMNRPVHLNTISGTPHFPALFEEHIYLDENRSLRIEFQNLFAVANNIRPCIAGRRYYPTSAASAAMNKATAKAQYRAEVCAPYFLTTEEDQTAIAVGGQNSAFFLTDPDAYFDVYSLNAVAYDDATGLLTGTFDFELYDATSGRRLVNGQVGLSNQLAAGNGLQPYKLPESWVLEPRQRIEMVFTNTLPANNISVYFTLVGKKIYV